MKKLSLLNLALLFTIAASAQTYITQVKPMGGKEWGYVDQNGAMIIDAKYRKCYAFSEEGLAAIYEGKKWMFINTSGQVLSTEVSGYGVLEVFGFGVLGYAEGLVAVNVKKKWGFMNTDGKLVIDAKYDKVSNFDGGYAVVKKGSSFFIVDKTGQENGVDDANTIYMNHFTEGLAPFKTSSKKFGFVNTDGKTVIEPKFLSVGYFVNGLAWARDMDKQIGYINKNGEWVINPMFVSAKDFDTKTGLAMVKKVDQWGYTDKNGSFKNITTEKYSPFYDGLARGKMGGLTGYYNADGKWVIEAKYNGGRDFKNGFAAVKQGDKWGFINVRGEWVIKPTFANVKDLELVK